METDPLDQREFSTGATFTYSTKLNPRKEDRLHHKKQKDKMGCKYTEHSPSISVIQPSFEGLQPIVKLTYRRLCAIDEKFKSIPECLFAYYIALACWARIKVVSPDSLPKKEYVHSTLVDVIENYPIPKTVFDFLSGIGDVNLNGIEYKVKYDIKTTEEFFDGVSGTFGRINYANHFYYSILPAPGIFAMSINNHFGYHKQEDSIYHLMDKCYTSLGEPVECNSRPRYTKRGYGYKLGSKNNCKHLKAEPNINFIGWSPSCVSSQVHKSQVLPASILNWYGKVIDLWDGNSLCYDERILNFVKLALMKIGVKLHSIPVSTKGSVAQIMVTEPVSLISPIRDLDPQLNYYSYGFCRLQSDDQLLNIQLVNAARIMSYNVVRAGNTECSLSEWCPITIKDKKLVPKGWLTTKNGFCNGKPNQPRSLKYITEVYYKPDIVEIYVENNIYKD